TSPAGERLPAAGCEAAHSISLAAPPLVGREQELAALRVVLQSVHPQGLFISMEGEAGVGKTRLAEEFLTEAQRAARAVIRAACYEGESTLAYGPFIEGLGMALAQPQIAARLESLPLESLAEAARLLPGLAERSRRALPPALPDGPGAQGRFFEALRQVCNGLLGGETPGIFFFDDLQWADSASLDLLAYLAHRLDSQSCWIVAVWRSREGTNSERLYQLQAEQQRAGRGLHLPVRRLNGAEIGRLARGLLNSLPAGLEDRLFAESEGLPFIALEYLRGLDPADPDWAIPGGVRDLLHRRLRAPSETARQLIGAISVVGRPCDFHLVQAVGGRSEMETILGMEELLGAGLLSEQTGMYEFTHQKLREIAYEEISLARRRLLHQRTAEGL
ncbi:MAG TPA: AAA family ATPase, partial [Anaerolinea sp.]|nr:AAA family ATPase [Anaerolinea sp.]